MRNRFAGLTLAAALIPLTGCDLDIGDFGSADRYSQDFHESHPLRAGGRMTVENFNGAIEITGWDENSVEISGAKYASTPELRDSIRIEINSSPDSIYIRTVRPSMRGNMGARYQIKVPRRIQLERIVSSNGAIRATGLEGPARVKTSNGAVRMINLKGTLDAQTTNGPIELQSLEGTATLRTSNGRIRAENVRGGLEANTSNGGINVELVKADSARPIKLDTSNGTVDLTLRQGIQSEVRISTSNGGITVHIPDGMGARVDASTSNSSITSEFDVSTQGALNKHHLQGTIGAGGPMLDLSTTNGSIRLLKM